jgi:hypothetical protein
MDKDDWSTWNGTSEPADSDYEQYETGYNPRVGDRVLALSGPDHWEPGEVLAINSLVWIGPDNDPEHMFGVQTFEVRPLPEGGDR